MHHSVPSRSGNNNDTDMKFVNCSNYVVRHFTTLTSQIITVRFRSCISRVSITKIILSFGFTSRNCALEKRKKNRFIEGNLKES